ncbi:MAG: hypothetical protein H6756_13915 [Candidatus Omnitrophica bacterium]|nr:hypothetical protein [Candidatus Omnitrophota bacterium]
MKCPACQKHLSLRALSQRGRLRTCNHCRMILELIPNWTGLTATILLISLLCGVIGYFTSNIYLIFLTVLVCYPAIAFCGYRFRSAAAGPLPKR